MGRTYPDTSSGSVSGPEYAKQFDDPIDAAQKAVTSQSRARDGLIDLRTALRAQWKAGQSERLKALSQAKATRHEALKALAATSQPGGNLFVLPGDLPFAGKKARDLGYPDYLLQAALLKLSSSPIPDPEKQARLTQMLALKAEPLKLDARFNR